MSLFRNIIKAVNDYYNPSQDNNQQLTTSAIKPYEWFPIPDSTGTSISQRDYYKQIAYACINARAEKLITAQLKLKAIKGNGEFRDIKSHPFLELIANPNIYPQSFNELIYCICISLDLYDNGAFLYYPKDIFGRPMGLYWLPSQNVSFIFNGNNTKIEKYRYTWGSNVVEYLPEEIIHFRLPNPLNLFYSRSTATASKFSLNAEFYQLLYNENFYKNGAAIGHIFTLPIVNGKPVQLSEEAFNRMKDQINSKTGIENAGKNYLAEGGVTVDRGDATPREAEYSKSHIDTRNEVCGLFRVPKSILGFAEDVNRANAEAANVSFLQNTIIPFSFHIWDRLDQFIKINYDGRLYLDYNYDLQESRELQISDYDKSYKKWRLTNEIRRAEGMEEIQGLDEIEIARMKSETNQAENQNQNTNEAQSK